MTGRNMHPMLAALYQNKCLEAFLSFYSILHPTVEQHLVLLLWFVFSVETINLDCIAVNPQKNKKVREVMCWDCRLYQRKHAFQIGFSLWQLAYQKLSNVSLCVMTYTVSTYIHRILRVSDCVSWSGAVKHNILGHREDTISHRIRIKQLFRAVKCN